MLLLCLNLFGYLIKGSQDIDIPYWFLLPPVIVILQYNAFSSQIQYTLSKYRITLAHISNLFTNGIKASA
jgi:hypothetical protein